MFKIRKTNTFDEELLPLNDIHSPVSLLTSRTGIKSLQKISTDPERVKDEILQLLKEGINDSKIEHLKKDQFFSKVAFTHDSKYAIVSYQATIIMLSSGDFKTYHTFPPYHKHYLSCLVTTKNDILFSACYGGILIMWNLIGKEILHNFGKIDPQGIKTLAPTSDEKYIVIGTLDGSIIIIDLATKNIIRTQERAQDKAVKLTVTNDSKFVISCGSDKHINIWNFDTLTRVHTFKNAHFQPLSGVKVSPDDKILYSSGEDGSISMWNLEDKEHIHTFFNVHSGAVLDFEVFKENFILSVGPDGKIKVCHTETRTCLHTFKKYDKEKLASISLSNDEKYAIIASNEGSFYTLEFQKQFTNWEFKDAHTHLIDDVKIINNDGGTFFLASAADDSKIKVWNPETKELLFSFEKRLPKEIWMIAISPDKQKIASACSDGTTDFWSISEKCHLFQSTEVHKGGVSNLVFSKDGTSVATCGYTTSIIIHDAHSVKCLGKIENAHKTRISAISVTNDNKYWISGSFDKTIALWDMKTLTLFYRLDGAHDSSIWRFQVSKDSKFLVSSATDPIIKLWDLQTKKAINNFKTSHLAGIRGLAFSEDENFVISVDYDSNMNVHHIKSNQIVWRYDGLVKNKCCSLTVTPDNKYFAIPSDKTVYMMQNPFFKLTVQFSQTCSPYTVFRLMPLTCFFQTHDPQQRKQLIQNYPELRIYPHCWNWFHIVAIYSPDRESIQSCFENNITFCMDAKAKTPLHYLFENKQSDKTAINLILSNFEKILKNSERPRELLSVHSNIFSRILELGNSSVVRFLKVCLQDPEPTYNMTVDIYGKPKGHQDMSYSFSKQILYSSEARTDLLSQDLEKKKISIKVVPFYWDYSFTSRTMRTLIRTLLKSKNQEIFETKFVSLFISYVWGLSRQFYYFMALMFSIQAILISLYTGLDEGTLALEILIFVISVFFLGIELLEILSEGIISYFGSIWNYLDLSIHCLVFSTLVIIWSGVEQNSKNWLFSFMLAFTYFRWISYFRVFKQTRKLMRMIIQIIKDMRGFSSLLAFIIFGLSLIFYQFDRETSYSTHLLNSYKLLYSDYDLDDMSTGMMFFTLIVIAIVCIVLLNMLIAIMGDTFGAMQESTLILDNKEMLELVLESMKILEPLDPLKKKIRKAQDVEANSHMYMFCAEEKTDKETDDEDETQQALSQMESKFNSLQNQLYQLKKLLDLKLEDQMIRINQNHQRLTQEIMETIKANQVAHTNLI